MLTTLEPADYLVDDDVIDFSHPAVQALSAELRSANPDDVEFARAAYHWVRDGVGHSFDVQDPRVTVAASQVLLEGVGLCYAKAHLLTALLRAEGIPAGLCYQRLTSDKGGHVVHGLIAVYLDGGWHRQDPRGSRPDLKAEFSLTDERLAWQPQAELGELDYPEVFVRPHPVVLAALRRADNILTLTGDDRLPTEL